MALDPTPLSVVEALLTVVAILHIVIEATRVIAVIFALIVINVLPIALRMMINVPPIAPRMIVTRMTKRATMIVAVPVRTIIAITVRPFPLIVVMNTAQIENIVLVEIIIVMTTVIAAPVVFRIAAVIRTIAPVTIAVPVDTLRILLNLPNSLLLPSTSIFINLTRPQHLNPFILLPPNLQPSQLQPLPIRSIPNDYLLSSLNPLALTLFSTTNVAYIPSTKIKIKIHTQTKTKIPVHFHYPYLLSTLVLPYLCAMIHVTSTTSYLTLHPFNLVMASLSILEDAVQLATSRIFTLFLTSITIYSPSLIFVT